MKWFVNKQKKKTYFVMKY